MNPPEGHLEQNAHPLRLLFATAEPHPSFRADVRVLFGRALPAQGVLCDLHAQAGNPAAGAVPWPAGRAWLAPATRSRWTKPWVLLRHDLKLFALARQGYDAVQVRDRMFAGWLGLMAARRAGLPFFYWASYPKPESRTDIARLYGFAAHPARYVFNRFRGAAGGWLLYRIVLARADHVFVQSQAMLEAFAIRGIDRTRMTAVPMGVDLSAAEPQVQLPDEVRRAIQGRRVVVYSGALDRVRNPRVMLEAMRIVKDSVPDVLLLLVGGAAEPKDEAALREDIRVLGLDSHVHLTGWVAPELAWACMAASEIGMSIFPRGPLFDVASPTKVAEYLGLGLPVVANDQPDQKAVLQAAGVGPSTDLDPDSIARRVLDLLAYPEQARDLGHRGRDWVTQHRSYPVLAARLAAVYRRLRSPGGEAMQGRVSTS